MKQKELTKKLLLNKKTVSNLDNVEMSDLKGGGFTDSRVPTTCTTNELYCTVATCDPYLCDQTWFRTCTEM